MAWESKTPYVHPHTNCVKPVFNKDFGVGSVWKCDNCARRWRCTKIEYGDQRDPGPYAVWNLVPESYYDRD